MCSFTLRALSSPLLSDRASFITAGFLINLIAFGLAAEVLFALSDRVLKRADLAWLAVCWFSITPAGIFMSATYTESLFALFSFSGMYFCALVSSSRCNCAEGNEGICRSDNFLRQSLLIGLAAVFFTLAASLRSNGMLLAAFLLHAIACILRRQAKRVTFAIWVAWLLISCAAVAIVMIPYVVFQLYGYYLYCSTAPTLLREWVKAIFSVSLPPTLFNPVRSWCTLSGIVPQMYGFVQSEYWGVGPLRYFEMKQIPQFLLASPMISLAVACAWHVFRSCFRAAVAEVTSLVFSLLGPLNFLKVVPLPWPTAPPSRLVRTLTPQRAFYQHESVYDDFALSRAETLPYIVYWVALVALGIFLMHVQVITRFVAASPALYWFLAHLWVKSGRSQIRTLENSSTCSVASTSTNRDLYPGVLASSFDLRSLTLVYVIGYSFVGASLFGCFYNWT